VAAGFGLRSLGGARAPERADDPPPRAAERSGDRFDALVRALPLGVMMLDRHTRVRFSNRASAAIFGFDVKRVEGAHLIEAVPSIELERRADAALAGEATMGPLIVAGKTGSRHYAVSVYPLTDHDDRVNGALVLAEDHTDLLALERARQEFLSNVSHELRTPLSSVKLMLETVLESPEEEAGDIFLPQALAQVDRLVALVARLLEQARAESGAMNLHVDEVDLEAIARPIVASFEPQAAAKNVTLEFRAERPIVLEADSQRLAQVLVNLIDNALRFTPTGGSVTTAIDTSGGYAVIGVSDTGIGIPYKDIPHIFERFYVVDRSRARDISGAGLGLSIVKQIVDAHNGTVTAESLLGSGTKFTVKIPVAHLMRSPPSR
jgi:two-component system phosphate regulon sensor histidine kinase PhoR